MKKAIIIILSMGIINTFAQTTKPIHFSLVQAVSTEGMDSKNTDYRFSLNMFSGTVNSIKGLEIGAFYNQNNGDMEGFQASGLVNNTNGKVTGFQTAGISNLTGSVWGIQIAGISNHAHNLAGIQLAGIANTASNVSGLQVAGILNQAKTLKGFQIGVINIADSVVKGGGIGLINIYKKGGYLEIEISATDYQNVGLSYKSGTKILYSILNIGYNFSKTNLLSSGFGIGSLRPIGKNTFFKPELIWYNYMANDFKFKNTSQVAHMRLGIMQKMGKIGLTLYPSIYYANMNKNSAAKFGEVSQLKPFSQNDKSRWGYGIGLGISFLK